MDIPQKIDEIIQKRKELLPPIEDTIGRVEEARKAVKALDEFRNGPGTEMQSESMDRLRTISTEMFYAKCDDAIHALEQLKHRFSREWISISFVGRAGQGKSLVLQRISGLEADVIPSADGPDCTGARSIISNSSEEETKARITFFTEKEIVDIVNRYLEKIFKTDDYNVLTVDDISRLNLGELRKKVGFGQVKETAWFDHLEKYVLHIGELKDSLGKTVTISKDKIESYVAQYNRDNHAEKYYTYLGVKCANILSRFPYEQCGRIVLVDTIGTGATALGVEEEMLRTVREDSDAIVLMMRPDALRPKATQDDYDLLNKILQEVSPEYAREMLFWLINRVETDKASNAEGIPAIVGQLKKQDLPIAEVLDVDCSKNEEVENRLLQPVLERMSTRLGNIDQVFLDKANNQLKELEECYHNISMSVERALGLSINQDERRQFKHTIQKIISNTTNQLRDLYLAQDKRKDEPCESLQKDASEKLKNILRSLPAMESIVDLLKDGTMNQFDVLEYLTDKLRLQIINDFLELNSSLHGLVVRMKRSVADVLGRIEGGGRLKLIVRTDSDDPDEWLRALRKELQENEGQFSLLLAALDPLLDFDLRMENFMIYKVRCSLRPIDWSASENIPALRNSLNDKEALGEEIRSILDHYLRVVHRDIRKELDDYYTFPNTALYAVLRDFYDRAVCSYRDNGLKVEDEWQYLYEDKIPKIWPEEHKSYIAAAGRAKEWSDLTNRIYVCAAEGYFLINAGEEKKNGQL